MMLLSSGGYLGIAIAVLVGLGVLAIVLYLLLRSGPKTKRKRCEGCADLACPIALSLNERKESQE